eukprot:TRINITY_DN4911_c0_g1_i1.p1 TRINITY_DN4911_c0_g1~~TRINITY_DN4911_c0_g1_i1.p1  ORF type:complete len:302 (+),score=54.76 TRINITY_DN4911_c0_g1_i1:53-907(+)
MEIAWAHGAQDKHKEDGWVDSDGEEEGLLSSKDDNWRKSYTEGKDAQPILAEEPGILSTAIAAARSNIIPALVLQVMAAVIVVGYYTWAPFTAVADKVAHYKRVGSYLFSAISTCLIAGMIPWAVVTTRDYLAARQRGEPMNWKRAGADGIFMMFLFIERGVDVDFLYRQQARLWGTNVDVRTIALKVLIDQGPYTVLWRTPFYLVCLTFKDVRFSFSKTIESLSVWKSVKLRYCSMLVAAWAVYIPTATLIYALPSALQIPLFNIVACFYTLLLCFITDSNKK